LQLLKNFLSGNLEDEAIRQPHSVTMRKSCAGLSFAYFTMPLVERTASADGEDVLAALGMCQHLQMRQPLLHGEDLLRRDLVMHVAVAVQAMISFLVCDWT
jgi:hypothetical protein